MSRFRTIQYGIDRDTGMVVSRVQSEVAIPVLDFAGMKPENGYETKYNLEKFNICDAHTGPVVWTRKMSMAIKNRHRKFWGMKPLAGAEDE
jgi:hypothetical protein